MFLRLFRTLVMWYAVVDCALAPPGLLASVVVWVTPRGDCPAELIYQVRIHSQQKKKTQQGHCIILLSRVTIQSP